MEFTDQSFRSDPASARCVCPQEVRRRFGHDVWDDCIRADTRTKLAEAIPAPIPVASRRNRTQWRRLQKQI